MLPIRVRFNMEPFHISACVCVTTFATETRSPSLSYLPLSVVAVVSTLHVRIKKCKNDSGVMKGG